MYSFPKVNHAVWKPASRKTLIELVVEGKLTIDQIRAIIFSGKVKKLSVRRALRKLIKAQTTTEAQLELVVRYYPLLHDY